MEKFLKLLLLVLFIIFLICAAYIFMRFNNYIENEIDTYLGYNQNAYRLCIR